MFLVGLAVLIDLVCSLALGKYYVACSRNGYWHYVDRMISLVVSTFFPANTIILCDGAIALHLLGEVV